MIETAYTVEVYKADKRTKTGRKLIKKIDILAKDIDSAHDTAKMVTGNDDKLILELHETYRTVRNLMSGEEVEERYDTPYCCSVGSETYWSM